MSSGIRAEMRVDAPADCRIARTSGATEESISSISRASGTGGIVTEELTLEADAPSEST